MNTRLASNMAIRRMGGIGLVGAGIAANLGGFGYGIHQGAKDVRQGHTWKGVGKFVGYNLAGSLVGNGLTYGGLKMLGQL